MTDTEHPHMSRAAHKRLADELEELTTAGRAKISERLQRARELGDLSENAEYHETKNMQGMMEARIRTLEHLLRNAEVVDPPAAADSAIAGMFVTLRPVDGGEDEVYLLAETSEERAPNARTVTVGSPLGSAVVGRHVGDPVRYTAPGGTFSYELVKLEPWDGSP